MLYAGSVVVTRKEYLRNIWVGDVKDKMRYSMSDFKKLAMVTKFSWNAPLAAH